jgi:hypothetical protein
VDKSSNFKPAGQNKSMFDALLLRILMAFYQTDANVTVILDWLRLK